MICNDKYNKRKSASKLKYLRQCSNHIKQLNAFVQRMNSND